MGVSSMAMEGWMADVWVPVAHIWMMPLRVLAM